jgi:uncharacterized protein (DUF4415 family)
MVRFEWDEAKRISNLRDHGVDFRQAASSSKARSSKRRTDAETMGSRDTGRSDSREMTRSWSPTPGVVGIGGSSAHGKSMRMASSDMRRYSAKDLEELHRRGETETRADAPAQAVDADFWASAKLIMPPAKSSVHLRVDTDVLEWFRAEGRGHLTRMNAVLRMFMEAHKSPPGR